MQPVTQTRQSIQQLSTELANQIAAGEVIERPASVVKELLENALDAGATQVEIDIRAAGAQLIRIRDNGHGIPRDELSLALAPHATSKIYSLDDLHTVTSMGFRGEALASIASVSELSLISRTDDQAWQISFCQDDVSLIPASHPPGTTVEVHNLFYNTPVRKRFLKAERTEYKHIEDVVKRIALANFHVGFSLKHNQRNVLSLAVANTEESKYQRIKRIINKEFISSAVVLNYENAGLRLTGWLGEPGYSRSQSDMQFFFVNGRMIKDKVITHAIRQAYQEKLYPGRFPVYILSLEMDPQQVDVNVHPTKHEVRFRQSRMVHDFLYYSLKQALANDLSKSEIENTVTQFPFNRKNYDHLSNAPVKNIAESQSYYSHQNSEEIQKPLGIALTKIDNKYLVCRNNDGLVIIHLEAARCNLLEHLISNAKAKQDTLVAKPVLIPFVVTISSHADSFLKTHRANLEQLGFELSIVGESELMVRQIPSILEISDLKAGIQKLLREIETSADNKESVLISTIINEPFTDKPEGWNHFLRQLESLSTSHQKFCYQLGDTDFTRWFGLV